MNKITKISIERVFNLGSYQSVRLSMEVQTDEVKTQRDVERVYNTANNSILQAFETLKK